MAKLHDEASSITAEDGQVQVDGVAVSLTPNAATETARRLKRGADDARAQLPDDRLLQD